MTDIIEESSHQLPEENAFPIDMGEPVVVLVNPQLGENIGAAARAMANFGLSELRLVAPRDGWPNEAAEKSAAGASSLLEKARIFPDLREAVGDIHSIFATTARPRDMAKPVFAPEAAVIEAREKIKEGQRVGFLFGPERSGLSNEDISLSNALVIAPVNPQFASLNLAQAVLLLSYEWLKCSRSQTVNVPLGRETAFDGPAEEGLHLRGSRPANKAELFGFFDHLESELDQSGFLKPPEKRDIMVRNIRNMFQRMDASEQEVKTLRGIVASLTGVHRRRRDLP